MPFQAVATQRLYEQVAGQVTELVARGEFKPGDRLPPERDLAKVLGVSRPTVREAMIALEMAGLVEVRVGAGTFVTDKAKNGETDGAAVRGRRLLAARADRGAAHHRAGGRRARGTARDAGRDRRHRRDGLADRQGARHAVASRGRPPVSRPHRARRPQQHPRHHRGRVLGRNVFADVRAHGRGHRPDRHALQPAAARHDRRRARGRAIAPSRRTTRPRRAPRWTRILPASKRSSSAAMPPRRNWRAASASPEPPHESRSAPRPSPRRCFTPTGCSRPTSRPARSRGGSTPKCATCRSSRRTATPIRAGTPRTRPSPIRRACS